MNALPAGATLTDSLTILAKDGTAGTITITITGINDKSSIGITGSGGSVTEDDTANATVTGTFTLTDPDTSPLPTITEETRTGTYGQLAIALKTSGMNDGEYTWTYTLDNDDNDTDALGAGSTAIETFTIAASDKGETMVTISITGANDAAIFSGTQTGAVTEDATVNTATGTITVSDVDGANALKEQADQTGSYGSLSVDHSTGTWTYTLTNSGDNARARATQALAGGETATDAFPLLAADDTETMVTITITGVNDAATIGGVLTGAITEDAAPNTVTGTAQATDVDGEDNKFTAVTAPASVSGSYGNLTISEDGAWTYSLNNSNATVNALPAGATLTDSLTILAKDGTAGTITITITGINDKSSIGVTGSGGSVTEDDTANATVTGTFTLTDPDTSPLPTITEETRTGTYGQLAIAPKTSGTNNGEYTWTYTLDNEDGDTDALAAGSTETETFTIAASDNGEAMVTISITGANDAATFSGTQTGAVTEDATSNTATGTITVSDVDGANALKQQADQTGSYGSLSVDHSTGVWTYTLTNSGDNAQARATQALADEETADETFTILAADDTPTTLTITITGVNDAATIGGVLTGAITEDAAPNTTTGTVTSTDVDGDNNVFKTEVTPNDGTTRTTGRGTYGTLTITAAGVWTYTLNNDDEDTDGLDGTENPKKTDAFTIMAADGTTGTVTITITGVNDIGGDTTGYVKGYVKNSTTGTATYTGTNLFNPQSGRRYIYGLFSINANGSWRYTLDNNDPDTRALGQDEQATETITIIATDNTTATITITIAGSGSAERVLRLTPRDGSLDVNWTAAASALGGYRIHWRIIPGGSFTSQNVSAGTLSYTITGLTNGTRYIVRVDPLNAEGEVNRGNTVRAEATPTATTTIDGDLMGAVTEGDGPVTRAATIRGGATTFKTEVSPNGGTGIYGTLTIKTNGEWTYRLDNSEGGATDMLAGGATATDAFTIMAADGTSGMVTITITGVNDDADVGGTTTGSVTEDADPNRATGTAESTDPDGEDNKFIAVTAPASVSGSYGSLTITEGGAWTYSLNNSNATVNALGQGVTLTDSLTIQAADGTEGTITITITGTNDNAMISNACTDECAITEGTATTTGKLTSTDVDGDNNVFKTEVSPNDGTTLTTGTGTYGTFTIETNGNWTYSLDNSEGGAVKSLVNGATDTDQFTIMAADGTEHTITITITGPNEPATIAGMLTGSVTEDADPNRATGTAESTDPDGEDNKFIAVTAPASVSGSYGSLTISEGGAWTYSLNNSNATVNALGQGVTLTDSLTIQAADGTEGTITITITGANDPVTIAGMLTGSVTEDAVKTDLMTPVNKTTGTATVTDVDGDNNSFKTDVTPTPGTYGSLTITPAGVWTYTLDNEDDDTNALARGATATDAFTIMAADGTEATVTITITGTNDPAVFGTMGLTGAVTEDAVKADNTTPDNEATGTVTVTDVDGTDNSFRTDVTPARGRYGSLTITEAGVWTYELDNSDPDTAALRSGQSVTDAFTIRAADWTPATVTITVSGADDPSKIGGDLAGAVTEDDAMNNTASGTVTLTGGDGTTTITAKTETSAYGMFTLGADRTWTYTLDNDLPATHALADGAVVTDPFTIAASDGSSATVIITITGAVEPDLLVASVSGLPTQWKDGTSFTATAVVRNQGKADAGSFEIGLYASLDRTITTGDIRIASASVSTLAKDASSSSVSLAVSEGFDTLGFTPGTYYLGVIADINGDIAEVDEGNNDDHANSTPHSISLLQDQPDLVVTSVGGIPTQWTDGGSFSDPIVVVSNEGEADAGAFVIGLYASADQTITAGDIPIGRVSVSALAKDMSTTVSIEVSGGFRALGLNPGTYYLGVIVDTDNQVAESDESNNMRSNTSTISLLRDNANPPTLTPKPNLVISSVSGLPAQWKDGERFTVSATVRNRGKAASGSAGSSFVTGLYASIDATITTGDTRIASASVSTLAKDASSSVSLAVSKGFDALGFTPGTYYLGVIPDIGNEVVEENEFDNNLYANRNPVTVSLVSSEEAITVDGNYSGRWGWRGTGLDGPRGVAVAPWGPAAPLANFETEESRFISRSGDPIGDIGARHAYAMGLDGSGVIVAVIDGHIDKRHSDLDDNFLRHYDASGAGVVGTSIYDGHGTRVAGIIAAERNGEGMHGVAHGADLIGISFAIIAYLEGSVFPVKVPLQASITSAVSDGARIFNNSYGIPHYTRGSSSTLITLPLRKSVADAIDEGAVFVWSAGNRYSQNTRLGDNNTSEFAKAALKYRELAGGFVNVVNLTWDSSNSVWTIANSTGSAGASSQICGVTKNYCLGAPGTSINSTTVGKGNNRYSSGSGTSRAAPMVSGGLAILFQAFPYVETSDILRLLFETATDLGEEGVDSIYGQGMMNLATALNPVGSASIPTTTSTATNAGINVQASALLAEAPLRTAVASATADMVMLDDYDRAFVIGDVMDDLAISDIQPLSIASADAVFASVDAELASLRDFGSPITQAAAKAGALTIIGDRLALPSQSGTSEVVLNSIATEDSGLAEFRYVATRAEEGWKASQSLGVIVEEDQLFGNKGSGAYALASQATTLSLGTSGQRDISEDVTLFGGLGLSRTEVSAADQSLVSLSSQFTSASGVVGLRMRDLGAEDRGEFAIQLGQDRAILSGEGSISVPVGRAEGGVILFDEVQFDSAALGLEPEVMVSYANEYAPDASYSLSAAGRGEETILSAQWQRTF